MMPPRKKPKIKKWGGGSYVALPHKVLKSQGYGNLSARAVKLLNDLLSQYHGNNNGNLCAAMTLMEKRGWNSHASLTKARRELVDKGFIAESRAGGRNRPTLFSLTFYSIDECFNSKTKMSRHEVMSTTKPANDWLEYESKRGSCMDLKAAQKKQKKIEASNNLLELKKSIMEDPNDPHRKQMEAGIKFWEAKQN